MDVVAASTTVPPIAATGQTDNSGQLPDDTVRFDRLQPSSTSPQVVETEALSNRHQHEDLQAEQNSLSIPEKEGREFCCPICLELLASPIVLGCGHTFDRECLVIMSQRDEVAKTSCPLCRMHCITKEAIELLHPCQLIEQLIDRRFPSEKRNQRVREHEKVRQARENPSHCSQQKNHIAFQQPLSSLSTALPPSSSLPSPSMIMRERRRRRGMLWLQAVYGPAGVESDEEVPVDTKFGAYVAAVIILFLLFSMVLDQALEHARKDSAVVAGSRSHHRPLLDFANLWRVCVKVVEGMKLQSIK